MSLQSNQETSRTTTFLQLEALETSSEPNSPPLLKPRLQKAKKPFFCLKKTHSPKDFLTPQRQTHTRSVGRSKSAALTLAVSYFTCKTSICIYCIYIYNIYILVQHTMQHKFSTDHKLCCASRVFIIPSPPPKQQAPLELKKIYVKVNRNCTDFMSRKCGIDTFAAIEPDKKHRLGFRSVCPHWRLNFIALRFMQ